MKKRLFSYVAALAIVASFSSCFDHDDDKFEAGFSGKYLIQTEKVDGTDTTYYYTPYFQIVSSKPIATCEVKSDKVDPKTGDVLEEYNYPMKSFPYEITSTYYYYSDMSSKSYPVIPTEYISDGPYKMDLKTVGGRKYKEEEHFSDFRLDTLGNVVLTKVSYVAFNSLEVYFKDVKGAVDYALFVSPNYAFDYRSIIDPPFYDDAGTKVIRIRHSDLAVLGTKLYIRLAATGGGRVVRESKPFEIDLEKDLQLDF